jgi:hypothetical protein
MTWSQIQVIGAGLLVALGLVFLALQAGILEQGSNWWVIFLFIPGVGLLWSAYTGYRRAEVWAAPETIELTLGAVLLILTAIFIFDPTWSFTRGIGPILPDVNWDQVWRWALLILGVALLVVAVIRGWTGIAVLGALIAFPGVVFVFDLRWDYVWPFALIIPGVFWLYHTLRQRST